MMVMIGRVSLCLTEGWRAKFHLMTHSSFSPPPVSSHFSFLLPSFLFSSFYLLSSNHLSVSYHSFLDAHFPNCSRFPEY